MAQSLPAGALPVSPFRATRSASRAEVGLHATLAGLAHSRLVPLLEDLQWEDNLVAETAFRRLEHAFVETERALVADRLRGVPRTADAFVAWFEELRVTGPGQHDPLFPWLAEEATLDQMRWFLKQEVAGEAGFEDLVALTQLRLPVRAKLELAGNYWDEMGQGQAGGMHGPMLERLAVGLLLDTLDVPVVWEAVAVGNLLVALAYNRRFAYQSLGALGVVELTAPGRAERVNEGLKRLGAAAEQRRYYALHATLDKKHSASWNAEVLWTLVDQRPETALPLAEGALLRLAAGARCFERYREELGVIPPAH